MKIEKIKLDEIILKNTIKSDGIILEHTTSNILNSLNISNDSNNSLNNLLNPNIPRTVNVQRSYNIPRYNGNNEYDLVEIDVYAEDIQSNYKNSFGIKKLQVPYHDAFFGPERILNVSLIECKGHSSSGFLLCKEANGKKNFNEGFIYEYAQEPEYIEFHQRENSTFFIDSADFYKNVTKENRYKKDSENSPSNKFYKAVEQIKDSYKSIERSVDYKISRLQSKDISYRILPLIVTNSRIVVIRITEKEVLTFENVPWVTLLTKELENFLKYIYVVNVNNLKEFYSSMTDLNMPPISYKEDHNHYYKNSFNYF